jgi:hypothetical protein
MIKRIIGILVLLSIVCVCFGTPLYNSFNAGELSEFLAYRLDLANRSMGVKTMENMFVKQQGAAIRRPGTKFVGDVNDSSKAARLIPFEYSNTDSYILVFNNGKIGFFRNAN